METPHQPPSDDDQGLQAIAEALRGLRFGSVTVIVQDGVVIQLERLEKRRLPRRNLPGANPTA